MDSKNEKKWLNRGDLSYIPKMHTNFAIEIQVDIPNQCEWALSIGK
jgi:hypothetical protein